MSFDIAVWFPHQRLSDREASEVYTDLDKSGLQSHPAVDAFYAELTARHPELDEVPEDRIDDHDYCPWSCAIGRSPSYVVMSCVWSKADAVVLLVHTLAGKHGLAVYDPQSGRIAYPNVGTPWKFWSESKTDLPLPPSATFSQALNELNAKNNSFYILEHENGSYMQCGGSREACSVEIRIYGEGGSYKHYVIGCPQGTDSPVAIRMSGGVINVREREVLSSSEAADLFAKFFTGEPVPQGYSLRVKDI